jgi:hypothetical protein
MNTNRRGFLGLLAAVGIAAVAGPALPSTPAPVPKPLPPLYKAGETYETLTFRRSPGYFDVVVFTGIGATLKLPNSLGDEIGCIILKCTTKAGPWHVLEIDKAEVVLPEQFNEAGEQYVAYQFGKEAMPQIQPYVDKLKEMYQ